MSRLSEKLQRNLSLLAFIGIYIIIVAVLIFLESFQWETQRNVFSTMVPFFLLGAMLDYMTDKNKDLGKGYKILTQLMPTGIFVLLGTSFIIEIAGRPPVKAFEYLIWLFIAVPFFITSYFKENYRKRMISSLLGTGFVGAVYLYLTTKTNELNEGNGLIVYLICIFLMFYAASGHKKLYLTGTVLGLAFAGILVFFRHNPLTYDGNLYGWDFDIAYKFELMLLSIFILCIIICFLTAVKRNMKSARLSA